MSVKAFRWRGSARTLIGCTRGGRRVYFDPFHVPCRQTGWTACMTAEQIYSPVSKPIFSSLVQTGFVLDFHALCYPDAVLISGMKILCNLTIKYTPRLMYDDSQKFIYLSKEQLNQNCRRTEIFIRIVLHQLLAAGRYRSSFDSSILSTTKKPSEPRLFHKSHDDYTFE